MHARAGLLDMAASRLAALGSQRLKEAAAAERIALAAWEGTVSGLSADLAGAAAAAAGRRGAAPVRSQIAGSPGTSALLHMHAEAAGSEGGSGRASGGCRSWGCGWRGCWGRRRKAAAGKQGKAGAKRKSMEGAADVEGALGGGRRRSRRGSCWEAACARLRSTLFAALQSPLRVGQGSALQSAAAALLQHCGSGGGGTAQGCSGC